MIRANFNYGDTIESSYTSVDRFLDKECVPRVGDEVTINETGDTWTVKRVTWVLPESPEEPGPTEVIIVLE